MTASRWKIWSVEFHQDKGPGVFQAVVKARSPEEALSKANLKFEREHGEMTQEDIWWLPLGGIRVVGGNGGEA